MTRHAATIELGALRVTLLSAGRIRLDGGAMFGVVPKALWARLCPADEENRIDLACHSLLIEWQGSDRRALVEAGTGNKYAEKERAIFALDPSDWLLPNLAAAGVEPASITDVLLTHLHFDHAGGLTHDADGRLAPSLPRARVHIQRREHDDARAGHTVMTLTYREENFSPLDGTGLWNLLEGEGEVLPGVRVMPTPGHTRGHQSIVVSGGGRSLVYAGDVLPTRHHLRPAYNMAFDLDPLGNRAAKQALLTWVADHGALLVIGHDVDQPIVRVRRWREWFEFEPAPDAVPEAAPAA